MKTPTALNFSALALLLTLSSAAYAQKLDTDSSGLKELAQKLPAVTEVLGNAIQVAQDCGMSSTDMQGTQHAYFTILSTARVINSFRTIGPEIKKMWPTESEFKIAFQRGQTAATKQGRPTSAVCDQVKLKFPLIDEHEEQSSHVLAARLSALKANDDREAEARIKAGHSPLDAP
jgi:hypothetical protein